MDAKDFFLTQHATLHGLVDQLVVGGVTTSNLRRCPAGGGNSLAWLLWHGARWEDVIVNAWICGQPQVFDTLPGAQGLGVATRRVGTGMTQDEVHDLSAAIDVDELHAYRAATAAATSAAVSGLSDADLGRELPLERLAVGLPDGAFGNERAMWMDEFWSGHPVSWFLAFLNLHGAEHLFGEALVVRSQIGIPLGL
jgi:hypothetical protein